MNLISIVLLIAVAAAALAVLRSRKGSHSCSGDCARCRGCDREK